MIMQPASSASSITWSLRRRLHRRLEVNHQHRDCLGSAGADLLGGFKQSSQITRCRPCRPPPMVFRDGYLAVRYVPPSPLYGVRWSSRNYEGHISGVVLNLVGHDPANFVQGKASLLRVIESHPDRLGERLSRLPVSSRSLQ